METPASTLKVGDRVALPEIVCRHVIVIGPEWAPSEVWLEDRSGHVHTLPGCAVVELIEAEAEWELANP